MRAVITPLHMQRGFCPILPRPTVKVDDSPAPPEWPKPSQLFQCPHCRQVFPNIDTVANHWMDCKPQRSISKLSCPFSGCVFSGKKTSLRSHLYAKHSRHHRAYVPVGVWPSSDRLEVHPFVSLCVSFYLTPIVCVYVCLYVCIPAY